MALNFPLSPSNQQTFTDITSGVTYVYYTTPGVWRKAASPVSGTTQQYIADGIATAYQLNANVANPQDIVVILNGLVQFPTSHYSLLSNTTGTYVNFTFTPYNGEYIEVRTLYGSGTGSGTGTLSGSTLNANNLIITGSISANGVLGGPNQFLASNGSGLYWSNGVSGPIGYTGSLGPQGPQGPAGGYTGSAGAASTTPGYTGSAGATGPSRGYSQIYQPGILTTTVGSNRWYAPANLTIFSAVARVIAAPQGSNITLNIKKDGTTQSVINITPGTNIGSNSINISMQDLLNDYITIDVVAVGSVYPGSDLNIVIKYTYN